MDYKEKIKSLEIWASDCQIAADELAVKFIEFEKQKKDTIISNVLQDFCNFNTNKTIGVFPWLFGKKAIRFVFDNHQQIKRKFELIEFMDFCDKYRMLSMKYNIKSFEDFKAKIRLHEQKLQKKTKRKLDA